MAKMIIELDSEKFGIDKLLVEDFLKNKLALLDARAVLEQEFKKEFELPNTEEKTCPVLDSTLKDAAAILNLQHHVNCRFDVIRKQIEALSNTLRLANYEYRELLNNVKEPLTRIQENFIYNSRQNLAIAIQKDSDNARKYD